MILSGTLHWLISQSIFLVVVESYAFQEVDLAPVAELEKSFVTCGYSPLAILLVIVLGVCMAAFGIVTGSRRLPVGSPPMASSCSASLSAVCHTGKDQKEALKVLKWGAVEMDENGMGHCAFSSGQVDELVEDVLYAGLRYG